MRGLNSIRFWGSVFIGKLIITTIKFTRRGGGSAFPGLVVEKLFPKFLSYGFSHLTIKPIIVSGTNGKTTTTKLITEILKSQDFKVITNSSGSNFTRGIASELINEIKFKPIREQFDISILELDEAYAKQFVDKVDISTLLILNISRDQLDRFGEVDATRKLLEQVAFKAEKLVLNSLDSSSEIIFTKLNIPTIFFTAVQDISKQILTEGEHSLFLPQESDYIELKSVIYDKSGYNLKIEIATPGKNIRLKTNLQGIYNAMNLTAAVATVISAIGDNIKITKLKSVESKLEPAWGRSQKFKLKDSIIHLILVKNPTGFNHVLQEFGDGQQALFALNDDYADGQDVSWIWDVNFSHLNFNDYKFTGKRGYDMAIRLKYQDIKVKPEDIKLNIAEALKTILDSDYTQKTIFASYTAMSEIHKILNNLEESIK